MISISHLTSKSIPVYLLFCFFQVQFNNEQLEEENMALKEVIDMAQSEITELKNTLVKITEEHETTLLMLHCKFFLEFSGDFEVLGEFLGSLENLSS